MKNESIAPNKILVATYGSLKRGFHNHGLLNNSQSTYLGEAVTDPKYTMYSLGSYPAVVENGETPIAIEVYEVTSTVKRNLDQLEGYRGENNPNNYYDATTVDTPYGEAVMYVIRNEKYPENRKVKDGVWKNKF